MKIVHRQDKATRIKSDPKKKLQEAIYNMDFIKRSIINKYNSKNSIKDLKK